MAITAVATAGVSRQLGLSVVAEWRKKRPEVAARTSDPCATRPAQKPGKPRHLGNRPSPLYLEKHCDLSLCVTKSGPYPCSTGPTATPLHYPR